MVVQTIRTVGLPLILGLVFILSFTPFKEAGADQTAPELDALFARLLITDNHAEAVGITNRIWAVWRVHEDDEVMALMTRGMRSMRAADLPKAVEHFSEVIRIDPDFAEGWNARATAYYNMGEYGLSTHDVKATLRLEPRHFGALSGQGLIYMALDSLEDALFFFERALDVNPHMHQLKPSIEKIKQELAGRVI